METGGKHHGLPGSRIFTIYGNRRGQPRPSGLKARDNAAFGLEPQGKGLANQVAYRLATADSADFACKRLQYGGIVTGYRHTSRKGGYIPS
jgi:hypothetical protein